MKKTFVILLAGAIASPAMVEAQRTFEVEPIVGIYAPHGSYDHTAQYFRIGTPEAPRENQGQAYGANVRLWLTSELGLQLQGIRSSADHPTVVTPGGGNFATSTQVSVFTAQALFRPNLPTRAHFWLSAGGGMIRHAGTAYSPYNSPSQGTIALGAGTSVPLWRELSATAGVDGLLYDWKIADENGVYQSGSESDLVAHLGLSLTVR